MRAARWLLPPEVLSAVCAAAGFALDDPPAEVIAAIRSWLPMGSTAKLQAIAAGTRPPGLDPSLVATARLAGPQPSWSCWAAATLLAALLEAGGHDVRILALHRRDAAAVSFDLHSALVVDEAWLVDPYLGPTALVPVATAGSVSDATATITIDVEAGRVTDIELLPAGHVPLRYRTVVDDVDAPLLAGILDVSTTHTGVPFERYVQWATPGELVRVSERDGGGRWHRFVLEPGLPGRAPLVEERWGRFDGLSADLAAHAGWT